ncbi:MAG: hypothetical protein AAF799_43075 [Myxococcota bacterium]
MLPDRVLEDVGEGLTGFHVDRLEGRALVELTHRVGIDPPTWSAFMTNSCGGETIEVVAATDRDTEVRMVGPWVTVLDEQDKRIEIVTDFGAGPRHELGTGVIGCPIPIADGLAFERNDGTVWFQPNPSDPGSAPQLLLEGSAVSDPDGSTGLDGCPFHDADLFRDGDSDGLLVLTDEGSIVRVSPDGAPEPVVEGPVQSFEALSNPRYVAWLRDGDHHRLIRDRDTGFDRDLWREIDPEWGSGRFTSLPGDRWVTFHGPFHNPSHINTVLIDLENVDLENDRLKTFNHAVDFHGSLSPTQLVISLWSETGIYDTETKQTQWFDMVPPEHGRVEAGWVASDVSPYEQVFTMLLLPSDGGPVEVLGEDLGRRFEVTDDGTLIHHETTDTDPHPPLTLRPRQGEPGVLAEDVVQFQLLRTADTPSGEHEELFYAITEGEDAGLWRHELP